MEDKEQKLVKCTFCDGTGRKILQDCPVCEGSKQIDNNENK